MFAGFVHLCTYGRGHIRECFVSLNLLDLEYPELLFNCSQSQEIFIIILQKKIVQLLHLEAIEDFTKTYFLKIRSCPLKDKILLF